MEVATWSARRDTSTGYGIAVFDVGPGSEAGGQTSITVRYYHAADTYQADTGPAGTDPAGTGAGAPGGPTDDYTLFETFTLVRPRSDGRRWHPKALAPGWRPHPPSLGDFRASWTSKNHPTMKAAAKEPRA